MMFFKYQESERYACYFDANWKRKNFIFADEMKSMKCVSGM